MNGVLEFQFEPRNHYDVAFRRRLVAACWPLYEDHQEEILSQLFADTINRLQLFTDKFTAAADPEAAFYKDYVVGFDCMSEEDGFPFCPFAHSKAIVCLQNACLNRPAFGLRLHAGEGVKRGSSATTYESGHYRANLGAHMSILFKDTKTIKMKLPALRLRIGHGIGFMSKPDVLECPVYRDDSIVYPAFNPSAFNVDFLAMRKFFKEHGIPIEVNMQSNRYLLPDTFLRTQRACEIRLVLRQMLQHGVLVVLSTDNHGIWPCDSCQCAEKHQSVAHEFCHAISAGCFDSARQLQSVVDTGRTTAFTCPLPDTSVAAPKVLRPAPETQCGCTAS